jgi:trk system potassium uptake protein TrkA
VHVVIMGCGRVGSSIAYILERRGHSVAVIDQNKQAFNRLSHDFRGRRVTGVGFDRDTLIESGIEEASAFAAVSNGDNSNIISARVARERFGVTNVAARIYDPRRAEVYERLGIPTVATVRWTADQMLRRLFPEGAHSEWADPSGKVVLVELGYHHSWIGHLLADLESVADCRVALLTRVGDGLVPTAETVLREGDLLHVTTPRERLADVERVLGQPAQGA